MATNSEETTKVVIYTDSYRIDGSIALIPGARLTDYVRNAQDFIAVVDATVSDKAGRKMFAARFLDVGREFIELIVPSDLIQPAP